MFDMQITVQYFAIKYVLTAALFPFLLSFHKFLYNIPSTKKATRREIDMGQSFFFFAARCS